ncbi:MAG: molecular chaperone DnaK [Desulfuromonas sp.]|nr:MAG: molecular chaperone DnaK [Desulfuromonas sp.]
MDDADRAKGIADQADQDALEDHLSRSNSNQPSRIHCIDCEEEISPRRRETKGVTRCINCQRDFEQRQLLSNWGPP